MDPIKGFAKSLLIFAQLIYASGYAGTKITPGGYMQMLLQNRANLPGGGQLSGDSGRGHVQTVKVRYQQPVTWKMIQEEDDCNIDHIPEWLEDDVPVDCFSKFAIFIPMDTIRKYADAASDLQTIGNPQTSIMMEFWDALIHTSRGLLAKMDRDLLTKQVTKFGLNVVTGSNAATGVNLPQDRTVNNLTTGITKILADATENEFLGDIDMVGSGLMNNFALQQAVKGLDSAGLDTSRFTGYKFHHDLHARNLWGLNQVGVFEKGSVQLLDINENKGNFSGMHGGVWLGSVNLPTNVLNSAGELQTLPVDVMLRFNECPADVPVLDVKTGSTYYEDGAGNDAYVTKKIKKGYYFIITKKYGQFNRPVDMFRTADRLAGNNGTLRYAVTNT